MKTGSTTSTSCSWHVELDVGGKITGKNVDVLKSACEDWLDDEHKLFIDFSGATHLDGHAVKLMMQLVNRNAVLINSAAVLQQFLDDHSRN